MLHEIYMQRALELARLGWGTTNPNPLVGAVIVKNGEVIGEGYHKSAGEPHAEINALTQAGEKAEDSIVYVNLEPCSHFGRTSPCTDALIKAGVQEVVIAMQDPNPSVSGKGIKKLKQAGIKVAVGILEEEAKKLNEIFIKYITSDMPFTIWKCAMTLDGKVATVTGDSKWITNEASREYAHWWRYRVSAIMAGIGTVLLDNPMLTVRLPNVKVEKQPIRIIIDSFGKTPLNYNVLDTNQAPTVIATASNIERSRVENFKSKGVEVITTKSKDRVNLSELMKELHNRQIDSVLIEGGPTLAASAIEEGLVDKAMIFIAPKFIGGKNAPSALGGKGVEKLKDAWNLKNVSIKHFQEDLLVEGYFI
ncbi:MAG TPA: bifunctional diaminohydroxyphosphoribosylaminopyrimidine deaminase/5-amino-6-(5-phosphoribosylamino)uracil reductase RibD [Defluviitoga sp.]|nr:bifunctional diaminohydroxyphosphoribosylaminopyrimidine deaminase/5-amino-6-(5-phosphoribosylamino)uracil reductase RibD [Defluviitoga sp.]HOP24495.1 bifunctional diaminohydroxyphosphoribosylaminopyrimidine deaminase/5-amino-6-(5-phosphoribosylamino)uracil reductase RibD [Defluviitoga sp.]HPZ29024.1 bifunctional diaminohydroxyphosphoribosylaminopyrimidine deaminase/5-amino-6-(5-phosphoribosylamino)uracil reductase RibD [Defluviitoga sp.]HQD62963.1 bifunctional diaminohydroxyphosphoribosylami